MLKLSENVNWPKIWIHWDFLDLHFQIVSLQRNYLIKIQKNFKISNTGICLVKYESSFRTHVKGPMNEDGSYDWGLFQINDRYWCQVGRAGKSCNIDCKDLLKDNISQAAACAKQIFRAHGFYAWNAWKDYCNGKTLPSISECF